MYHDAHESDRSATLVQIINGSDAGARAISGLTDDHREGRACLYCGGTEDVTASAGYVDGIQVKVHSYHQEPWRMGETALGGVEIVRAPHVH